MKELAWEVISTQIDTSNGPKRVQQYVRRYRKGKWFFFKTVIKLDTYHTEAKSFFWNGTGWAEVYDYIETLHAAETSGYSISNYELDLNHLLEMAMKIVLESEE